MIQHPFLFSDALQVLAAAIRPEKEMKGILTGNREMKLSLSADHLCRKSKKKKKSTEQLLEHPISYYRQVLGYES